MAKPEEVERLRVALRVGGGTEVLTWIATTIDYFHNVLHVNPLDPIHLKYLRGIDFHRPVTARRLEPPSPLVRFPEIVGGSVKPEVPKPYRFFAIRGATPLHLGWNQDEMGFQLFQLQQPVRALLSYASGIRFGDNRSRLGGDCQVIIPWKTNLRLVRERDFDRQKMADMLRAGYRPLGLP